jgi:hypothetical protein
MNSVRIKHDGDLGRQEEPEYPVGTSEIRFRNMHAKKVDLSNLSVCTDLKSLDLSHNSLTTVDLRPLAHCPKLERIDLRNNRIESLDLWPLIDNSQLRSIQLSSNSTLRKLDVTPVLSKANLTLDASVVLSADSALHWVLTQKQRQEQIHLVRSDGVSWSGFPIIIWNGYEPFSDRSWGVTKTRIKSVLDHLSQKHWFGAQRGIMSGLGLRELSGYDGNPMDLLAQTTDDMTYGEAVERVHDHALDLLEAQIAEGGPNLFLDSGIMKRTGASRLLPKMIEARKREIDAIVIPRRGSKVYLRGLWLTHYGFEILSALGIGLRTDLEGLKRIQACFSELGFELTVAIASHVKPRAPVYVSASLRKHVILLVLGRFDSTLPL